MSRLTDEQICALAKKIVSNAPFTAFDVECMNIIKTDEEAWQDLCCAMSVYKITGNLSAFAAQPSPVREEERPAEEQEVEILLDKPQSSHEDNFFMLYKNLKKELTDEKGKKKGPSRISSAEKSPHAQKELPSDAVQEECEITLDEL